MDGTGCEIDKERLVWRERLLGPHPFDRLIRQVGGDVVIGVVRNFYWGGAVVEEGVGDGRGPRITVFLIPILSLVLIALFYFIPKIEPKKNIYKFKSQYTGFMNVTLLFMLFFNGITIAINMGIKLDLNRFLALGIGNLFYFSGVYMKDAKQNWFFGIRTWWTLSNETVWDRTHEIGSKLFKACGVIALAGALIPQYAIILILVPVLGVAIYLIYYSQKEYSKIIQDVTARSHTYKDAN